MVLEEISQVLEEHMPVKETFLKEKKWTMPKSGPLLPYSSTVSIRLTKKAVILFRLLSLLLP